MNIKQFFLVIILNLSAQSVIASAVSKVTQSSKTPKSEIATVELSKQDKIDRLLQEINSRVKVIEGIRDDGAFQMSRVNVSVTFLTVDKLGVSKHSPFSTSYSQGVALGELDSSSKRIDGQFESLVHAWSIPIVCGILNNDVDNLEKMAKNAEHKDSLSVDAVKHAAVTLRDTIKKIDAKLENIAELNDSKKRKIDDDVDKRPKKK